MKKKLKIHSPQINHYSRAESRKNLLIVKKLIKNVRENKLIVAGVIFFIFYKFFFVWMLFNGRKVPPEPDDSYYYLSAANRFPQISSFEDFRLFYFSAYLKSLSQLTGNLETAFKTSFFIGSSIIPLFLLYFLKKTETNKSLIALALFFLAFYHGSGAYHGFYWVVPSVFQVLLFFVILGIVQSEKKVTLAQIFFPSLLFIFSHPTSLFVSSVFGFYFIIISILNRKIEKQIITKAFYLFVSLFFSFAVYFLLSRFFPVGQTPQSFEFSFDLIRKFFSGQLTPDTFGIIWKEYFAIFSAYPLIIFSLLITLAVVFVNKNLKLISTFLACLVLVLIASYIPYGARTLAFLWPVTFLVIAYATFYLHKFLARLRLNYLILIPILFFACATTTFNLLAARTTNGTKNYVWNRNCAYKLENQLVLFQSLEAMFAFSTYTQSRDFFFLSSDNFKKYFLQFPYLVKHEGKLTSEEPKLFLFEEFLANNITRRKADLDVKYPINYWTQGAITESEMENYLSSLNLNLAFIQDCGAYGIYKVQST